LEAILIDKKEEIREKIISLRKIIDKKGLGGILLTQQYNISWISAGGNNHVLWDDQNSLIGILVTEKDVIVLAENGDFFRIQKEEFSGYPFEFKKIDWYGAGLGAAASKITSLEIGVDASTNGIDKQVSVAYELSQLRAVLLDGELERYKLHGKLASKIITDVSKKTSANIPENEIAAMYAKTCIENGFSISVILIGGDERSLDYRHQVVTEHKIKKHYSFVGVGRKEGFVYPICRTVSFGKPTALLEENHRKIEKVYVYLNSLAKIGTNLKMIYDSLPDIYKSSGLESDEWRKHTQGGITAYLPREFVLCEGADYKLKENNIVGWNPSIPGVMAEDLYALKEDGLEFITDDGIWPTEEVSANGLVEKRPSIMVI
jgi:Xaa-Pro aminopeptidase